MVVLIGVLGCRANTTRPAFLPYPEAHHGEIGFGIPDPATTVARATRTLAEALRADSIPVTVAHELDGFVETPWFDAVSLVPTARRPLGPDVVRVRAWVNPTKPGFSEIEIETVFRPVADPSRPARELESPVAADHPVARRVGEVVKRLVTEWGEPPDTAAVQAAPGPPPVARPPTRTTRPRP